MLTRSETLTWLHLLNWKQVTFYSGAPSNFTNVTSNISGYGE